MSKVIEFPKRSRRKPPTSDNQEIEYLKFQLKILEEEVLFLSKLVRRVLQQLKKRGKT
jgi:hypothetical protein